MSKIHKLPLIGKILTDLNYDIKVNGLKTALNNLIRKTNSKLDIFMDQQTEKILKKNGTVIVANHPHEIETIAVLASLPKREDINLVISAHFINIVPNLDQYLIPVYLDHHDFKNKTKKLSAKINNFFLKPNLISKTEAHAKNIQSIKSAAQKVKQGDIVVILPEGFRGRSGKWFDGIGYLLKEIGEKDNTYFVKAHIKNSSNWDYLRLLPWIGRLFPKIKIYYSEGQKISQIVKDNEDGKAIKNRLEVEYNKWVELLR